MNCASCHREIADGSNFCPYCGATQPETGAAAGQAAGGYAPPPPPMGSSEPPSAPPAQPPGYGQTPAGYGQAPAHGTAGPSQRATTSMVLGISSIVLSMLGCCCYGAPSLIGIGLGIAAWVMGRNEQEDIAGGFAPSAGETQANTGKITGLIGGILGGLVIVFWVVIIALGVASEISSGNF